MRILLSKKRLYFALLCVCLLGLLGARPMLRGYPLGTVTNIDKKAGIVSVDLGSRDGVFKGMEFSIVDGRGRQITQVTAKEVYADLFWSEKTGAGPLRKITPGMEVRWIFTPEVSTLLDARKRNTLEAYKGFVLLFPDSRFLPELIRLLPDAVLKELNPDYYNAWKLYTKEAFRKVIEKYPGTGFARAAEIEIKSLEAFEAEGERIKQERAKRAAEAEAQRKKQEAVEEKMRSERMKSMRQEARGRLVNNSDSTVRFVFDPETEHPPVTVQAHSFSDYKILTGNYTYKVYKVEESAEPPNPDEKPQPLKEGSASIEYDFWEAAYP